MREECLHIKGVVRVIVFGFLLLCVTLSTFANNVRLTKEVYVDPSKIINNIGTLDFKLEWDNSWRDDMNWDAVYLFVKYKKKNQADWQHVYLMDGGHTVGAEYDIWITKVGATANQAHGAFIYRKQKGAGAASVQVELKWLITQNGLTVNDFINGEVDYSVSCLEMVYVPQGAFCLGDGISKYTFKKAYSPILPEWDLIKNDGVQTYYSSGNPQSDEYIANPPALAANRVNEPRSKDYSNAWYATQPVESWYVDFGVDKNGSPIQKSVRYFGVTGVTDYLAYRPISWALEGCNTLPNWVELKRTDMNDWTITSDSYPVSKAIAVPKELVKPYRYYRINIINSSNRVMANNIAMTEVNIPDSTDYAYVIDKQTPIVFNVESELSAEDGDTWSGTLNATYPTGFNGFYAMKYELTQEQYVRFLNKLQYKQQKARTVGDKLDQLVEGDYVYGQDKTRPNFRNGIVIGARADGNVIFTCNLNKGDGKYAQDGDGQNIACNYLSPADMLAYADWAGLRPLSELEFEKMARRPYPNKPLQREFAWNENEKTGGLELPAGSAFSGTVGGVNETLDDANVNGGGKVEGPVRVGSFAARGGGLPTKAGASYWGIMELSGNLSETYYNLNTPGREFDDIRDAHGDGAINVESHATPGTTNMSASYWPVVPAAFCTRGGSFKSEKEQLAISDRTNKSYLGDVNRKDSTVTFRLGHSYTNLVTEVCTTYLRLANGKITTADGVAIDTVCAGTPATIYGSPLLESSASTATGTIDVVKKIDENYSFIWYISENSGKTWRIIPGENRQNLTYDNFYNDSPLNKDVWFKRKIITSKLTHETFYAKIRIINVNHEVDRLMDTITWRNHSIGFWIDTKAPTDFTWKWKVTGAGARPVKNDAKNRVWDFYAPERESFLRSNETYTLQCNMNVVKKCMKTIDFKVYVEARPITGVPSSEVTKANCGVMMQDSRGSKYVYGTVKIGDQCWMSENLRYFFPGATSYVKDDPIGERYGALYRWSADVANGVCPPGWRLPKKADIAELNKELNKDGAGLAGKKLKAGNRWNTGITYKNTRGDNSSGFGAVGSGHNSTAEIGIKWYMITVENFYVYLSWNSTAGLTYGMWWGWQYGSSYPNWGVGNGYQYNAWPYWASGYNMPARCLSIK